MTTFEAAILSTFVGAGAIEGTRFRMSVGRVLAFFAAAAVSAFLTLLIVNLVPEARLVRRVVPHEFAASDERFLRTMSGFSNGWVSVDNAVQTLVNGDEIFPSMLAEI